MGINLYRWLGMRKFVVCLPFMLAACETPEAIGPLTDNPALYRFAVIGDYGNRGPVQEWAADDMWTNDVRSILTVGDNIYPDPSVQTYEATISPYFSYWLDEGRFLPALGNHDWNGPEGSLPYQRYFKRDRYYDVDLDPEGKVHVYVLDSDPREPDGTTSTSTQANWFRDRITANRGRSCFHVVVFHHPILSTNVNPNTICDGCEPHPEMDWNFESLGVDAVFVGHSHWAERFTAHGLNHWTVGNTTHDIDPDNFTRSPASKFFRSASGYLLGEIGTNWLALAYRFKGDRKPADLVVLQKTCQ